MRIYGCVLISTPWASLPSHGNAAVTAEGPRGQSITHCINQTGATSGFEMYFAPSTFGVGRPNQNTSRIQHKRSLNHILFMITFAGLALGRGSAKQSGQSTVWLPCNIVTEILHTMLATLQPSSTMRAPMCSSDGGSGVVYLGPVASCTRPIVGCAHIPRPIDGCAHARARTYTHVRGPQCSTGAVHGLTHAHHCRYPCCGTCTPIP